MSKRSYQRSKESAVSVQQEARSLLWQVAGPPAIHDNRKSWLAKAARTLGWGSRRTKAIFYLEARTITATEWRTLNDRLDALKAAERRHGEQAHELREAYRMARSGGIVARRGFDEMVDQASHAGDARQPEGGEARATAIRPAR